MEKYRLNFYIVGINDIQVEQLENYLIDIKRKGDVWNKRTGKQYKENIAKKTIYTSYEKGFEPIINELIFFIKENTFVSRLLEHAREISLQICVDLDEECRIPYIHFTSEQLSFFSKINSEIDFQIS